LPRFYQCSQGKKLLTNYLGEVQVWWFTSVIPDTLEAEIRRIVV
jgi:hypothetical protein